MDALTKEEVKAAIVLTVTGKFAVSEEELANSYRVVTSQLAIPIQTLLAELIMEEKVTQRLFRLMAQTVRVYYFPIGAINAHFLQTEMALRMQYRPADFDKLNSEEQWNWDKALGILDYRGES